MNIKNTFLQLTQRTYPHGTELELYKYLPQGIQEDGFGNFYIKVGENSTTMFTCHLDTASVTVKTITHIIDGDIIKTDGETILGADDKAGMVVLLYMIQNNVPGLYYFFVGEERGCVGSSKVSDNWDSFEFSQRITKCISFDRRGCSSVITEQIYGPCCSDVFAQKLSEMLNQHEENFNYKPDPSGIYTDSAQFTNIIDECTNISVGYYNEHTSFERQDILHLEMLCRVVCKVDWENLPVNSAEIQN